MMLTAERAISRFERDLTLGAFLRGALLAGATIAVGLNVAAVTKVDGTLVLMVVGMAWVVLSYRSVRGTRLAAESPSLIASGDFEQAEERIEQALTSFSLFRSAKVLSLHHLALLRHAQRRWRESAMLSRTLLRQRLGGLRSISKPSRLLLADALLEMNDLAGVYAALADLHGERLTLVEAMNLLLV